MKQAYPILEYDPTREAMIEPSRLIQQRDLPEHCVLCFFQEVIDQVVEQYHATIVFENQWENGPHRIFEIAHAGQRLAFFQPGVGAALAAGRLEEAIAAGCRKFIVCGGCGVLAHDHAVGSLFVVSAAIRDEGVSYHYLPPGREVTAHPAGIAALQTALKRRGLPYQITKTWTTDAPYRETRALVAARSQEGCRAVDMEAAGLLAVAEFRNAVLGQVLYGGDDLSGEVWENRRWQSRRDIRENLFWLAVEACLDL